MSIEPAKAKLLREADIRDKLPDDVMALIEHDRARDAWESLFAIADVAGGDWCAPRGRLHGRRASSLRREAMPTARAPARR